MDKNTKDAQHTQVHVGSALNCSQTEEPSFPRVVSPGKKNCEYVPPMARRHDSGACAAFASGIAVGVFACVMVGGVYLSAIAARERNDAMPRRLAARGISAWLHRAGQDDARPRAAHSEGSELGVLLGFTPSMERRAARDLRSSIRLLNITRQWHWQSELHPHPQSASPLQDGFVRLHNVLHASGMLPLSAWGLGRGHGRRPSHENDVVQRLGLRAFFSTMAPLATAGSVCLEWGSRQYTALVPSCAPNATWKFVYSRRSAVNRFKRTIYGDLTRSWATSGREASKEAVEGRPSASLIRKVRDNWAPTFDVIICNQVFEHLSEPLEAAANIARLLSPGGHLFFTAPFLEPFHQMPSDYFRFTHDGARHIFERVGLQIVAERRIGNTMLASGMLLGFGAADFDEAYLNKHLLRSVGSDPKSRKLKVDEWAFLESALVARKPEIRPI
jgi:hypothetical protein